MMRLYFRGLLMMACIALLLCSTSLCAQSMISIDGSSTVYPITRSIVELFESVKKQSISVNVTISGSGGGFKNFCQGEIAIVNASRPILKNEMAECKKNNIQYVEIPVAFDAVTVSIHPDNHWATRMSVAQLKQIWEPAAQGIITQWNHINPAWPAEKIALFGAIRDSGTYDYFTEAIVGKTKSSRTDFVRVANDAELMAGIASNKYGLGFLGFSYYIENQDKINAVAIDSGKGGVMPSIETVEDGSYQPLSRPVFIYVNSQDAEKQEVKEFVEFYLKNALLLVKEVNFFPLPPKAYNTMLEHFRNKRVGTIFSGTPAIGLTIDELIRREGRLQYENY